MKIVIEILETNWADAYKLMHKIEDIFGQKQICYLKMDVK